MRCVPHDHREGSPMAAAGDYRVLPARRLRRPRQVRGRASGGLRPGVVGGGRGVPRGPARRLPVGVGGRLSPGGGQRRRHPPGLPEHLPAPLRAPGRRRVRHRAGASSAGTTAGPIRSTAGSPRPATSAPTWIRPSSRWLGVGGHVAGAALRGRRSGGARPRRNGWDPWTDTRRLPHGGLRGDPPIEPRHGRQLEGLRRELPGGLPHPPGPSRPPPPDRQLPVRGGGRRARRPSTGPRPATVR